MLYGKRFVQDPLPKIRKDLEQGFYEPAIEAMKKYGLDSLIGKQLEEAVVSRIMLQINWPKAEKILKQIDNKSLSQTEKDRFETISKQRIRAFVRELNYLSVDKEIKELVFRPVVFEIQKARIKAKSESEWLAEWPSEIAKPIKQHQTAIQTKRPLAPELGGLFYNLMEDQWQMALIPFDSRLLAEMSFSSLSARLTSIKSYS